MEMTRRGALAGATVLLAGAAAGAEAGEQELRAEWGRPFAALKTAGVFALHDPRRNAIVVSDRARARRRFLPASTFKIPNALIALETQVVADADHPTFRWDGVVRGIEGWNQDHTLRSAFKVSAVPVYQEIARRIGQERMARHVAAFDYGNRDISGGIDTFWLRGALRITALQQIDFLRRLNAETLPASKHHQAIVKDIMLIGDDELGRLRAKTGAVGAGAAPGSKAMLGWLVGWLERAEGAYTFALNLDIGEPAQLAARVPLAKTLLRAALAA